MESYKGNGVYNLSIKDFIGFWIVTENETQKQELEAKLSADN